MGVGGVLTIKGLIAGCRQWEVIDQEREKEWVKEMGEGENMQSGREGEGKWESEVFWKL